MTREEVAAAAIALVIGLASYDYKRYRFWWESSGWVIAIAVLAIGLLHGAFGYVAASLAEASNWTPFGPDDWGRNALVFAGLGEAVPRTAIGRSEEIGGRVRTALGYAIGWIEAALDYLARQVVAREVIALDDDARLERVSLVYYLEVNRDPRISAALRAQLGQQINTAAAAIRGRGGDPSLARGQLNAFLIAETVARQLVYRDA